MGKTKKWVARKLRKKTSKSLICATVIFVFALSIMAIYTLFIINEQIQMNRNFYNNKNTHIIEISTKKDFMTSLNFLDKERIKAEIDKRNVTQGYCVSNRYLINFGMSANDDNSYFICSYDSEIYDKLELFIDNDIGLTTKDISENITLDVPHISIEQGGFCANDYTKYTLGMNKLQKDSPLILSFDEKNIFVSKETYEEMISIMYGMDYKEFVKQYLEQTDMGIGMIDKIIVYVDDITDVKSIAKVIDDIGYNPSYTLNAFDNLTTALETSKIIGFIVMFAFFVITIVNMNNAYDMYLRNSQKDIGILKHYGYSKKMILSIYMKNFRNMLYMTFGIISALTVVSTFLLMKSYIYIFPCISLIIVIIMMFVLLMIVYLISRKNAKKIINKNVLVLVKFSKENE